jgi:competence protein ComEA
MARDPSNLAVTIVGFAVLVVLSGVVWFGLGADQSGPHSSVIAVTDVPHPETIRVHISGSVTSPGVVELRPNSIVADAVRAAGGALLRADLASINLAAVVRTGERIVVPDVDAGSPGAAVEADSGIDVNTASASQLEALPGVGPVLAERIVAHRTEHGPFLSVEDLLDVPGIGEAKLNQMRDAISYP